MNARAVRRIHSYHAALRACFRRLPTLDPVMVAGGTEPGLALRQPDLTQDAFAAAQAVDEELHRPGVEVSGGRLVAKLIGRAPGVEGLQPVRPRSDHRRESAGDRDQIESAQGRPALDAGVA